MAGRLAKLSHILGMLEAHHGRQTPPSLSGPFEMIVWNIVAYLQTDERRMRAFQLLKELAGTDAHSILNTPLETLRKICRVGGAIAINERADRLRQSAALVVEEFDGDLSCVLKMPTEEAKRALMRFPMIGAPGAETILLFSNAYDALPLDSNGLRVAVRLGFGEEQGNYAKTYESVRAATRKELPPKPPQLIRAHLLLRVHGQKVCSRQDPACRRCPVREYCPSVE
jgi:endonuclease-3